jgi:hypothetical protein
MGVPLRPKSFRISLIISITVHSRHLKVGDNEVGMKAGSRAESGDAIYRVIDFVTPPSSTGDRG